MSVEEEPSMSLTFAVPQHVRPIRQKVREFIERNVYAVESALG